MSYLKKCNQNNYTCVYLKNGRPEVKLKNAQCCDAYANYDNLIMTVVETTIYEHHLFKL